MIITLQASLPSPGRLFAHSIEDRIEMCLNSPIEYLDSFMQFSFFMTGRLVWCKRSGLLPFPSSLVYPQPITVAFAFSKAVSEFS